MMNLQLSGLRSRVIAHGRRTLQRPRACVGARTATIEIIYLSLRVWHFFYSLPGGGGGEGAAALQLANQFGAQTCKFTLITARAAISLAGGARFLALHNPKLRSHFFIFIYIILYKYARREQSEREMQRQKIECELSDQIALCF
jgi:hypothetical protein